MPKKTFTSGSTWTTCYSYDNDGNLSTQTSPGVGATFTYDAAHRMLGKSYNDGITSAVRRVEFR